jgi:hypothetical protein
MVKLTWLLSSRVRWGASGKPENSVKISPVLAASTARVTLPASPFAQESTVLNERVSEFLENLQIFRTARGRRGELILRSRTVRASGR